MAQIPDSTQMINRVDKIVLPSSDYTNATADPFIQPEGDFPDNHIIQIGAAFNFAHGISTNPNIADGIGFSFKLGYNTLNMFNLPISLYTGLGFDYLYFGGKSNLLDNGANLHVNSNAYGWYPYVEMDLFPEWPVSFFGNAYYGVRFYKTRQNITYFDKNNQKQTTADNIEGDQTQIYGWGGGVKIKIVDHVKLELRYQRNFGNVAKIIDPESITFDNITGKLKSYTNSRTDTDFTMFFLGIILSF